MNIIGIILAIVAIVGGCLAMDDQANGSCKYQKLNLATENASYFLLLPPELQQLVVTFVIGDNNPLVALHELKKLRTVSKQCMHIAQKPDLGEIIAKNTVESPQFLEALIRLIYAHDEQTAHAFINTCADLDQASSEFVNADIQVNVNTRYFDRTPLAAAAESGYTPIATMLFGKVQLDPRDRHENTPLLLAIKNRQREIALALISQGADGLATDNQGLSILMWAIMLQDQELIEALITAGAVQPKKEQAYLPDQEFLEAVIKSQITEIEASLAQGINPNIQDLNGTNTLMFAVLTRNQEIVKHLLRAGVSLNAQNRSGWTALHFAAFTDQTAIVKLLTDQQANSSLYTKAGETVLSLAASSGNNATVSYLLENGACNKAGALRAAAKMGHILCSDLLIDSRCINSPDKSGRTPLLLAAMNGQVTLVRKLLDSGALVDQADSVGRTALSYACHYGYKKIAKLLLRNHAYVDSHDINGYTCLMYAVIHGHKAIVNRLLKSANLHASSNRNETVLTLACKHGHPAIAELLSSMQE